MRAKVTALSGFPTALADILFVRNGEVVREVQAKVSRRSTYLSRVHSHNKYAQMDRLVPSDRTARIRQIADGLAGRLAERGDPQAELFADTADNVTGELLFGSVRSGGTTVDEAMDAATESARYADQMEFGAFLLEVEVAVGEVVKSGAIFGGAISVLRRIVLAVQADATPEGVLAGGLQNRAFQVHREVQDQEMAASFVRIDAALAAHDHAVTIAALEDMAELWGRKLGLPPSKSSNRACALHRGISYSSRHWPSGGESARSALGSGKNPP